MSSTNQASGRERPILFSGKMVRAILDDRKTQTRRIVNPQPDEDGLSRRVAGEGPWLDTSERVYRCPGSVGQHLWVRETLRRLDEGPLSEQWCYAADGVGVQFREDNQKASLPAMLSWARRKKVDVCVSIHMPRWASRITLEITELRVERLQEITEEDARAEGLDITPPRVVHGALASMSARENFVALWHDINGKRAPWSSNPWVWVIAFKPAEARHG